jgi:excisionase family DNA binding protein
MTTQIATSPSDSGEIDTASVDLDWLRTTKAATVSRNQAAQVLGVDARTVTRGITAGEIPAIKLGGRTVIPTRCAQRRHHVGHNGLRRVERGSAGG